MQTSPAPAPLHLLAALGVVILAVGAFLPVLHLGYVWDDLFFVSHYSGLSGDTSLWEAAISPVLPGSSYFRPLALATFALEFRCLGVNPAWSHAINLGLHALNSLLITLLALRVAESGRLQHPERRAMLAGVLYALHPVMIEPVAFVSARFDLLVASFLLLALHADVRLRSPAARALTVTALFLMAALCKEMAVTFPAVLLSFQLCTRYRDTDWRDLPRSLVRQGDWMTFGLLMAAGFLYLIVRHALIGSAISIDDALESQVLTTPLRRLGFVAATALFYLGRIIWPFSDTNPLHPVGASILAGAPIDALRVAGAACLLGLLALGIRRRKGAAILGAGALIALLPVLNIIPIAMGGNIGRDYFLTFPLAMVALSTAAVAPMRIDRRVARSGLVLVVLWIILAGFSVANNVPRWSSNQSLWSWMYEHHPDSPYAQEGVLKALVFSDQFRAAKPIFDRLQRRGPLDATAQLVYGEYLVKSGDPQEGLLYLQGAMLAFPPFHAMRIDERTRREMELSRIDLGNGYVSMAKAQIALNHYQDAKRSAETALFYLPDYGPAREQITRANAGTGRGE